jgi:hypothetical protein
MKKRTCIFGISCVYLFHSIGIAQNVSTRISISRNSFALNDIRNLEDQAYANYQSRGISVKKFGSFQPYWGFQLQFLQATDKTHSYGVFYGFTSTGSRIQYEDYSGEARTDITLFRWSFGCIMEGAIISTPVLSLDLFSQTSLNVTRFKFEEFLSLNPPINQYFDESLKYRLYSVSFTLGLSLPVLFLNHTVQFNASMEGDIFGTSLPFRDSQGKKLKCDWSGARLGLTYYLTKDRQFRFR